MNVTSFFHYIFQSVHKSVTIHIQFPYRYILNKIVNIVQSITNVNVDQINEINLLNKDTEKSCVATIIAMRVSHGDY